MLPRRNIAKGTSRQVQGGWPPHHGERARFSVQNTLEQRLSRWATRVLVVAVFVAIYADLLKWYVAGITALAVGYGATALLVVVVVNKRLPPVGRSPGQAMLALGVLVVTGAYVLRGGVSFDVPVTRIAVGIIYVTLPLIVSLVLLRVVPLANMERVANAALLMMLPVHFVGVVQYLVDPGFLVHTTYSESGGIVARNLLHGGIFHRLPSIFASADRYAGLSAVQGSFVLTLIVLHRDRKSLLEGSWLIGQFFLAVTGVLIAGARSRILLLALVLVAAIIFAMRMARSSVASRSYFKQLRAVLITVSLMGIFAGVLSVVYSFPVVDFLLQSLAEGDISERMNKALAYSQVRDTTTILGSGVGSLTADGRPGEFGIRSMWLEMGLLFGLVVLAGFALMLFGMVRRAIVAYRVGDATKGVFLANAILFLIAGLLAGLSTCLELSTGVMVAITIAYGMSYSPVSPAAWSTPRHLSPEPSPPMGRA